jgi:hypothetical protein
LYGVGRAELLFQQTCGPARTAMSFRDVFVRADIRSRSAQGGRGTMVKHLCVGLIALACLALATAADATDLSMVPIYKTRPSMAATLNGSTKDQSRPADVPDRKRFKLSPSTEAVTPAGAPLSGHVFWTSVYDRF